MIEPAYASGDKTTVLSFFLNSCVNLGGTIPVCFFVISGYVIAKAYDKVKLETVTLQDYMKKRFMRLFPTMFVSIILMSIAQFVWHYKVGNWWMDKNNDVTHVLLAITGLSVGTGVDMFNTVNGPIWYISILLICYFLYYLLQKDLIFRFTGDNLFIKSIIMIGIGFSIINYFWHFPLLTLQCGVGYIGFFSGVIIAEKIEDLKKNKALYIGIMMSFPVVFLLCAMAFRTEVYNVLGIDYVWLTWATLSTILIAEHFSFFGNPFFSLLSRISFPIYLFQFPAFVIIQTVALFTTKYLNDGPMRFAFYSVVVVIISIIWCSIEHLYKLSKTARI